MESCISLWRIFDPFVYSVNTIESGLTMNETWTRVMRPALCHSSLNGFQLLLWAQRIHNHWTQKPVANRYDIVPVNYVTNCKLYGIIVSTIKPIDNFVFFFAISKHCMNSIFIIISCQRHFVVHIFIDNNT